MVDLGIEIVKCDIPDNPKKGQIARRRQKQLATERQITIFLCIEVQTNSNILPTNDRIRFTDIIICEDV